MEKMTGDDNNSTIISSRVKSIAVTKQKMTNLVTKRIIISKAKAGDLLPTISNITGRVSGGSGRRT